MLNHIGKIADSWTSAHKGHFKSGPRVPFIAGKNTSQSSSQSSIKSSSQSEGNKTSDYTGNRLSCYGCGKSGHLRRNYPSNPGNFQTDKGNSSENVQFCLDDKNPRKFMCCGSVRGALTLKFNIFIIQCREK